MFALLKDEDTMHISLLNQPVFNMSNNKSGSVQN